MTIEQLQKNLESIDLKQIEAKVLKDLEPDILDLNIDQLSKGEGASGSKLPKYASPEYEKGKRAEGLTEQAGSNYNILLTGDYREGMFLEQKNNESFLNTDVGYKDRLNQLTDNDILGLQDNSMKGLEPQIIELTCEELEKQINK